MFKTRTWAIVFTAAALLLGAAAYAALAAKPEGVVRIVSDGVVLREIDLGRVTEEYRFTVDAPHGGSNVVTVQPGRIRVSEADCPDQVCVRQGWLAGRAAPIVCAPHRLVIAFEGAADADAVAR